MTSGNHYLFHTARAATKPVEVKLQGQFDEKPRSAEIGRLRLFGNPADKYVKGQKPSRIADPYAHLSLYDLYQEEPEPTRRVIIENQFGPQRLTISDAVGLLAPAGMDDHLKIPRSVSHYKLYIVTYGVPVNVRAYVGDQFFEKPFPTRAAAPVLFAVPVSKWHHGDVSKHVEDAPHMVLYDVRGPHNPQKRPFSDQFAGPENVLRTWRPELLGVPTDKRDWVVVDGKDAAQGDAEGHLRLEYRELSQHHLLDGYNEHESKAIKATVTYEWHEDGKDPVDRKKTGTAQPLASYRFGFEYGEGAIKNYEIKTAELVDAEGRP